MGELMDPRLDQWGIALAPYLHWQKIREQFDRAVNGVEPDDHGVVVVKDIGIMEWPDLKEILPEGYRATTSNARRLLPIEPIEYGAFQWHHDCRPGQIKAMLYLTDVDETDQHMSYLAGSHKGEWPQSPYAATRFSNDSAILQQFGDPARIIGPAGTLAVFNTNGLHRGNRRMGRIRDTVTVHYERAV